MILTSQGWFTIKYLCSRSSGYWVKEYVLTWGDLHRYGLAEEKSAEVIVVKGNEPRYIGEVSQTDEGPNIELGLNSIRSHD